MRAPAAHTDSASSPRGRMPGDEGIWALLAGDLTMFSILFMTFAYYFRYNRQLFIASQGSLHIGVGLFSTAILLASSAFVAIGVHRSRKADLTAVRFFDAAALCGIIFALLKIRDYHDKVSVGLSPMTNDYFLLYFTFTGIHLLHVVVGTCLLLAMRESVRRNRGNPSMALIESGALFWHVVDLLWIVLFSLFYLAR